MFSFFSLPARVLNLERSLRYMSEVVNELKTVIAGLQEKVVAERLQVNEAVDVLVAEVEDLKAKLEAAVDQEESDFTEVFEALAILGTDIEAVYVEVPEVDEVDSDEVDSDEVIDDVIDEVDEVETEELEVTDEVGEDFVL